MLWNVTDVVSRTQTLLDDPAGDSFDNDYLMPFLNQRWDDLSTELSMLGLQYQEVQQVLTAVPVNTANLSNYMTDGQPLQSLMLPKRIEWKPTGAPDTEYVDAEPVDELDDYPEGTVGVPEYAWIGGSVLLVPSGIVVDLRVTFEAMSVTLVDPDDQTIRGVTNIIAYMVAELVYAIRGNKDLAAAMQLKGDAALDNFERAAVMRDQAKEHFVPPRHPRLSVGGVTIASTTNS